MRHDTHSVCDGFLAIGCGYEKDDAVYVVYPQMQGQGGQLRLALKNVPRLR